MLGYVFGVIMAFSAVVALALGLFNISSKWASSTPSCNRSDSYGGGTAALASRETSIGSKGCHSGRCHCGGH